MTAAALLLPGSASADETIRRVQEELRNRRLYHGDLDGEQSPELGIALKRYQARKGFPESGVVDAQTLRSMGIAEVANVPILRSDVPAQPPPPNTTVSAPTPMSIAGDITVPPPSREELDGFMRRYLEASQTETANDDLALYAPRVDYFEHGIVPKTLIRDHLVEYHQLWPQRKYTVEDEITISKRGDNTAATARVAYQLANPAQNRKADGAANHTIVLARTADQTFEIVGVQEQRVRGSRNSAARKSGERTRRRSSKKQKSTRRMTPLDRTLNKFFNPPKRKRR